MKLREAVIKRLSSSPGEQLRARDLAEWLAATHPEACEQKAKKSGLPVHTVRVGLEIGSDLITQYGNKISGYQGVTVEGSNLLGAEIKFYRSLPAIK